MPLFRKAVIASLMLAAGLAPALAKKSPADIPVEAFASLPDFSNAKLSPNGQQIGYITVKDGRNHLVLQNLDGSDPMVLPPINDADIKNYFWASDERLLLIYEMTVKRQYFQNKTIETRLVGINCDGSGAKPLVKPRGRKAGGHIPQQDGPQAQFQHIILDHLPDDPDHIILSVDSDIDDKYEVRKINIHDGDFKELHGGTRGIQNWYMDYDGNLKLASGYDGGDFILRVRDASGEWISLHKTDWHKKFHIKGFTENPDIIYVGATGQYGTEGLYKLALDSGEIVETVFEHETVDVDYIVPHPETGKPAGVAYTTDLTHIHYFDKTMRKVQGTVDRALKNSVNTIVGKARGQHIYLIFAETDRDPGVYYWLNLEAGEMSEIALYKEGIDPALSAPVKPVSIPMRDGTNIPGYLTLPVGRGTTKQLPVVILPHGGPIGVRDSGRWDWWAQFLASRGYVVLQPNYRGSGGYGAAFENAGRYQWGGLMQNDVTDATKWLIEEGIADKDRICIAGASYGGYAALMGPIMEPGLYKCAVSINGVTNLPRIKSDDKYGTIGGRAWTKTMGLRDASDESVSPFHRADEINVPTLIMSSKDDARIDYKMSRAMHQRLKDLKKKSQYVLLENGGHSMDTTESRLSALKAMEKFLKRHIGGN